MKEADEASQREAIEGSVTVAAVSVALVSMTAVDGIMAVGTSRASSHALHIYLVQYGQWLFTPAIVLVFVVAARIGVRGLLAACAGLTLSGVIFANFRGAWIWPGTFDRYEQSASPILVPIFIGIVLGCLFVVVCQRRLLTKNSFERFAWGCLVVLACSTVWSYFAPLTFPIDSGFAPLRYVGLSIATVVLAIGYAVFQRKLA